MGTRAERPLLTALLLALALPAAAQTASTTTVAGSTFTVSGSTPVPVAPAPEKIVEAPFKAPAPPTAPPDDLGPTAVSSLRALASSYTQKRRTVFMHFVSDDFLGDLGTLEDALSSDFRSYRTIVLDVVPGRVDVRGLQANVQFVYSMTVTNDLGKSNKFSGQAAYTFLREEKGAVRLYRMTGTPIFGTSLSSIENPVATSQGASTVGPAPGGGSNTAPAACPTSTKGQASIIVGNGFNFTSQTVTTPSSADVYNAGSDLSVNAGAGIVDQGSCNFSTYTTPPATINDTDAPIVSGDCYAVRTAGGKYAVLQITGTGDSTVTFNYKFQPSGDRCF